MERSESGITLKVLWKLAISKWLIIVLAAVLASGGWWAVKTLTFVPEYQSTATLYILQHNEDVDAADAFSLALKLVNDCSYMIRSHLVLDTVREELSLDMDYAALYGRVSTNNPENTRILEVTVRAESPQQAKRIVDALCDVAMEKITATMGTDQVNLFEYGTLNEEPCNRTGVLDYAKVGIAAAVLTYTVLLLAYLLKEPRPGCTKVER